MTKAMNFQKGLKTRHVSFIALGGIIGSSYFLGTGYILNQIGPAAFLAYILGGMITFLTLACLAELSTGDPIHGSFVSYAAKYISPSWACGVGWSYWISWVVYIPSECVAAGIIMHNFAHDVPVELWSILFGLIITLVNLLHVKVFGELEFWLALVKIFLLVSFSILAIIIFFGLLPKENQEIIGTQYLLKDGGFFPNGYAVLFMNMVILLSNFQGSEIIGLTASESHDPGKSIPAALKQTSYRIIGLYLVPTFLLALILPWKEAGLTTSVFSYAMAKYGLVSYAHIFSFLVIAAALSCANSGLYGAIRSLHGLAIHHMGPRFIKHVNAYGVPLGATMLTLGGVWILLLFSFFCPSHTLYANLLAISGFTGSMCWISICWSQLRFRKKHNLEDKNKPMIYKVRWFPFLTLVAIWVQVLCLFIVLMSPSLRLSFYLGMPALIVPMILYHIIKPEKPLL